MVIGCGEVRWAGVGSALVALVAISATACSDPLPTPQESVGVGHRGIVLEPMWSVGEGAGEEQIVCSTDTMLAAPRAEDRFYVGPTCVPGQVAVLDGNGTLTGIVGSAGEGPGELQPVATIFVDAEDRLHVFQFPRRHTVFDPQLREIMRSDALPLAIWAAFPAGGASVRNLRLRSEDADDQPLHRVDDEVNEVRLSFGAPEEDIDPEDGRARFRSVTSSDGLNVWSARHSEYVLEKWNAAGERTAVLRREPEWWVRDSGARQTNLWDIELQDGFLWTLAIVPTFAEDTPPADIVTDPAMAEYFDTMIEVIDPETNELVAQLRRDEVMTRWVGTLVYSHRNVAGGGVAMDVWRVSLSGNGS